jgi:hypothetical protein
MSRPHLVARPRLAGLAVLAVAAALAGCGGSSPGIKAPAIQAARSFRLGSFQPAGTIRPGATTAVTFTVRQPSGKPLTSYKTGPGPHTGVHLIIVRDDLSTIVHRHPHIAANGEIRQPVTLHQPGPYRVLVDVYPQIPGGLPNFQLFGTMHVAGAYHPKPLPPFSPVVKAGGNTFTMHGHPHLKALRPAFITVTVKDAQGRPATFTPWYGALAHAIFFRKGSLDYFHTHVCGQGAANCTSTIGGARITGHSTTPGKLTVGILLPVSGTWRLFLQCRVNGRIVTAPFTLKVA